MGQCCPNDPLDYYELDDKNAESKKKLSLCILTWDVGGNSPTDEIAPLLKLDGITQHQPDIYVIGLQDTATKTQSLFGSKNKKFNKWESKIEEILNTNTENNPVMKHKYVTLESLRIFGMLSLVLVSNHKKELFSETSNGISNIVTSKVATGLLNNIGHKGAVGVHFRLFNKCFNFINVHFNSHQGNDSSSLKSKIDDYNKVMRKLRIFDENEEPNDASSQQNTPPMILDDGEHNPDNKDIIFVFGDLNYRSNLDLENIAQSRASGRESVSYQDFSQDFDTIVDYMNANNFVKLSKIDELKFEMKNKNVFVGFNEERIRFPPTYKYKTGKIDHLNDKKLPSYCDRILWKVSNTIQQENKVRVKCHKYVSAMEQVVSDHKPVVALFTIDY